MKKKLKKKIFKELTVYTVIEDKNHDYKLTGLLDENGYQIPTLDINGDLWDGHKYLYENLYNTVVEYLDNNKFTNDFVSILSDIPLTDFPIVRQVLEKGMELGFHKNINKPLPKHLIY